jgi:hypothetical protein
MSVQSVERAFRILESLSVCPAGSVRSRFEWSWRRAPFRGC